MAVFRILKWEDFEEKALAYSPAIVFYQKDKHPLRRPPIGLRPTFYHGEDTYAFIGFVDGATLRKMEIPVHASAIKGEGFIDDWEIVRFLSPHFKNAKIRSMVASQEAKY